MREEATRVHRDPTLQMGPVLATAGGTSPEMASSEAKARLPSHLQVSRRLVFQHLRHPAPYGTSRLLEGGRGLPTGPAGTALTLSEGSLQWCQEAGKERAVKCVRE